VFFSCCLKGDDVTMTASATLRFLRVCTVFIFGIGINERKSALNAECAALITACGGGGDDSAAATVTTVASCGGDVDAVVAAHT